MLRNIFGGTKATPSEFNPVHFIYDINHLPSAGPGTNFIKTQYYIKGEWAGLKQEAILGLHPGLL